MPKNAEKLVESLFVDRGDDLLRYLNSRVPNREVARDLAQEAYLRLLRHSRADLIRHPEAYLFRIAANLMHENWLKTRPENGNDPFETEMLQSDELCTESAAAQQQSIDALERVLRTMPPTWQQAVLLHRRDGLTYCEISVRLGVSVGMVRKYLAKGLARCREQLRRYSDE